MPETIQCDDYCHGYKRVCDRPPFQCGGCRRSFIDRDGVCLPHNEVDPERQEDLEQNVKQGGPDSDIDLLAEKRTALNEDDQVDESNDAVNSVRVEAQGKGAQIPPNATIERIAHLPGHSQDRKVHDVYKAAAAGDARKMAEEALNANTDAKSQAVHRKDDANMADIYFLAVIAGCSIAGLIGLVVAGVCWYRLQKNVKAASEAEYPAYGVTGPVPEKVASPGDRKLAQSAQMYHYQHQKQQMIAMEKANGDVTKDGSDADSEEENEEGDYTVYECPGLAPTGEMEVKNPLFSEETPVTPSDPSAPK